jgi:hypothetical protein
MENLEEIMSYRSRNNTQAKARQRLKKKKSAWPGQAAVVRLIVVALMALLSYMMPAHSNVC